MYNKQKARKKILLKFFHRSPEVSNVEQSTPLNLAKENPRLKSQSVNSSSAKGKGAIPTTLARWSAGRQSVVRLCLVVSPFCGTCNTTAQQMQSIQSTHQVKQRN